MGEKISSRKMNVGWLVADDCTTYRTHVPVQHASSIPGLSLRISPEPHSDPGNRCDDYSHVTDGETEAQEGEVNCPKPLS